MSECDLVIPGPNQQESTLRGPRIRPLFTGSKPTNASGPRSSQGATGPAAIDLADCPGTLFGVLVRRHSAGMAPARLVLRSANRCNRPRRHCSAETSKWECRGQRSPRQRPVVLRPVASSGCANSLTTRARSPKCLPNCSSAKSSAKTRTTMSTGRSRFGVGPRMSMIAAR